MTSVTALADAFTLRPQRLLHMRNAH